MRLAVVVNRQSARRRLHGARGHAPGCARYGGDGRCGVRSTRLVRETKYRGSTKPMRENGAMIDWTAARIVLDIGRGAHVTRERRRFALPRHGVVDADVYRPAHVAPETLLPVVVFVHGDASPDDLAGVLDWGQYRSWGEAIASVGLAAVVFRHRSSEGLLRAAEVAAEIGAVLAYLRREGATIGVDGNRLAIWTCSAGSSFGATAALRADPPVACLVSYYGFLDVRQIRDRRDPPIDEADLAAVSAAAVVLGIRLVPPTLIVKAALDRPEINDSIDAYVAAVAGHGPTEVLVHPTGHHAFDIADDDATSADLIRATIAFLVAHLRPGSSKAGGARWQVAVDGRRGDTEATEERPEVMPSL